MDFSKIRIEDYNYPLADEQIAKYPLQQRDQSKMLFLKHGKINEKKFFNIPELLPKNSLLLFNETKVIQARLMFQKSTGAKIEIFCLEPIEPSNDFQLAMQQQSPVVWKCLIGGAKKMGNAKVSANLMVKGQEITLFAEKKEKLNDAFLVEFSWEPAEVHFSEILETSGLTPLPPYLHRDAEASDKERYQTVYARLNGSVAAPTAGLHFTENILSKLDEKGIDTDKLVLHVGAGTFKPVSSDTIDGHEMHTEKIRVKLQTLQHLLNASGEDIIPVGTTSMRSLESMFWMALNYFHGKGEYTKVEQWDPYQLEIPDNFSSKTALELLIKALKEENKDILEGETQMIIVPGYKFRFAKGLITNFHQPKSTLLLLVAALIGETWKEAYDFALKNNFRFLSYGDSCLFLP
jgi:S-adenosylmethionine:tRNA ribosyltransferase-isomerase